jgi:hypothetical protein
LLIGLSFRSLLNHVLGKEVRIAAYGMLRVTGGPWTLERSRDGEVATHIPVK